VVVAKSFSWPIRTLGFSYDGVYLASGSEDLAIDIVLPHPHIVLMPYRDMSRLARKQNESQLLRQQIALRGTLENTGLHMLAVIKMDR
jgi:hypothetical protein